MRLPRPPQEHGYMLYIQKDTVVISHAWPCARQEKVSSWYVYAELLVTLLRPN